MLEKPDIPDELITSSIQSEYRLDVAQVTFLPLGLDVNTAVYRIEDRMGIAYFLILRKGDFNPITGAIPNFLSSLGVHTVIAPIETQDGQLFGRFEDYTTILYPFIPGKDGYEVRLAEQRFKSPLQKPPRRPAHEGGLGEFQRFDLGRNIVFV